MKGFQISTLQLEGLFKSKNIEMKDKPHVKLVHELYGACFQATTLRNPHGHAFGCYGFEP